MLSPPTQVFYLIHIFDFATITPYTSAFVPRIFILDTIFSYCTSYIGHSVQQELINTIIGPFTFVEVTNNARPARSVWPWVGWCEA